MISEYNEPFVVVHTRSWIDGAHRDHFVVRLLLLLLLFGLVFGWYRWWWWWCSWNHWFRRDFVFHCELRFVQASNNQSTNRDCILSSRWRLVACGFFFTLGQMKNTAESNDYSKKLNKKRRDWWITTQPTYDVSAAVVIVRYFHGVLHDDTHAEDCCWCFAVFGGR